MLYYCRFREVDGEFDDLDKHDAAMTAQVDNATETHRESLLLWKQWQDVLDFMRGAQGLQGPLNNY